MRIFPVTLGLLIAQPLFAQESVPEMPRQSASLEIFGSGLTYTLNYERFFYREPRFAIGLRTGAGFTPPQMTWAPACGLIGVTALWGMDGEYLELGASHVVLFDRFRGTGISMASFLIGYRYQPAPKGILFRAAFTPFYAPSRDPENGTMSLFPYAGFSVGYAF